MSTQSAHLRLPLITDEAAPEALTATVSALKIDLAVLRVHAHAGSFAAFLRFNGALSASQQLDMASRELVIMYTGILCGAEYEWSHHVPLFKMSKGTDAQIAALKESRLDDAALDERQKVLARFVRELVVDVRVSDATLEAAKELYSTRELIEIMHCVGVYMLNSRIALNAGITRADDRFPK